MRAKHEWRTCGCGQQIRLRESCKRCADAARARLHAEGFCRRDGTGQPYDCGKPPLGPRPAWARLKLPSGRAVSVTPAPGVDVVLDEVAMYKPPTVTHEQMRDAVRHVYGYEWADALQPPVKHEPPPVGAEVSYEVALADMQRRPDARYMSSEEKLTYKHDGADLFYYCTFLGGWDGNQNRDDEQTSQRWTRLPDATTVR
jgi:hypothetical protein